MRKLRTTDDDEDDTSPEVAVEGRPAWMTTLKSHSEEWLSSLPRSLSAPVSITDSISRFIARETWTGRRLLERVRKDLSELVSVCDGSIKQTNELRALMQDLNRGNVPSHWAQFKMPKGTSVGQYISDLAARLAQLEEVAQGKKTNGIELGQLFQPEAYITATRQAAAHAQGASLEQLVLSLVIDATAKTDAFVIEGEFWCVCQAMLILGLKLHGAAHGDGKITLNDGQISDLGASQLVWKRHDAAQAAGGCVNLPVYLNGDRSEVLFGADLVADAPASVMAERGVCITAV